MLFHLISFIYNFWPLFFGTHMLNWMVLWFFPHRTNTASQAPFDPSIFCRKSFRWPVNVVHRNVVHRNDPWIFAQFLGQISRVPNLRGGMVFEIFYIYFSIFMGFMGCDPFRKFCDCSNLCFLRGVSGEMQDEPPVAGVSGVPKRWGVIWQFGDMSQL